MNIRSWSVVGAIPVLALAFAGCQTPAAAPGGSGGESGQPTGPKVDRIVMMLPQPSTMTLEVRNMAEPWSWPVRPMYDYLIGINNQTSKLEPGLLESWTYEADGKALRGKLRQGVKFHNDFGEVKSSDVKFGWERMTKTVPDSTHGQLAFWRNVEDIDLVSDHEVLFRLKGLDGNFVVGLSEQQGGIEVQSKAHFEKLGGPPTFLTGPLAGSGPYQHIGGNESTFIRYQRVPWKHWRAAPDFPEFEFRYVAEASTRQAALLAGEAHLVNLPEDLLKQAEQAGMKVLRGRYPGTRVYGAMECCQLKDKDDWSKGMLHPDSPLQDPKVRRAINKAVNRDELNKAFFGGKAETMYVNHINASRPGWSPEWEKKFQDAYGYDVARARALLSEAGYGPAKPLKTNIIIQSLPGVGNGGDLAEAMAGYMRAVGIQVDLLQIDAAEYDRVRRTKAYNNHIIFSASGSNAWSGWTIWNSNLQANPTRVVDQKVDGLLRQLQTTVDEKKRDELFRQVGDAGFDAFMNINLFWLPTQVVVNPKVIGDWVFPGDITGGYTHVWEIKAAK